MVKWSFWVGKIRICFVFIDLQTIFFSFGGEKMVVLVRKRCKMRIKTIESMAYLVLACVLIVSCYFVFIDDKTPHINDLNGTIWPFNKSFFLLCRLIVSPQLFSIYIKASNVTPFPSSSGAKWLLELQNAPTQTWWRRVEAAQPRFSSILELDPFLPRNIWSLLLAQVHSSTHIAHAGTHKHTTTTVCACWLAHGCLHAPFSETHS